ncbi:hypothetical protein KTR10_00230 [Candidatus Kaiserbacteria bacterium]|nr:hypothetical protein [Candidatus Kaiserbacteria bacterium]
MADAPRSSFIPKQVAQSATPGRVKKRRVFNNISFFGSLFLGVTLLLAVGTFAYKYYIGTTLTAAQETLATERGRFSEADFAVVYALNRHLDAARYLLDRHSAPSKIFGALEESTKVSVQYTDFELRRMASGDLTITLDGATDTFGKIVLQNLQYVEQDILRNATVTGVSFAADSEEEQEVLTDSEVIFKVSTSLPVSDVGYTAPEFAPPVVEELPIEEESVEEVDDTVSETETEEEVLDSESESTL